ncbi:helix-turn-helix domain-containing protein [Allopontixanthobacter sp.]|uniref:TetR/AcrR family transcriptional regulator n=1 Tax=Allopontixanthobacter sp. TaxID=2906452 RepID=UPI002ABBF501|nr:helix-turn-helix domain-containing protein [Allopontixanthobacter sp.]MDZ4307215.1 helix-turn-helix domain-containing protein [Allopontixanthobacter sp.]
MAAKAKHRQPIIDAAVRLFRQRGYAATGLSDLVEASGSPKGSMYHYFPAGKPSIAVAAVEEAGRRVVETMEEIAVRTHSTAELLVEHGRLLGDWMDKSGFRDGCPMTTVLLELAPDDRAVTEAGRHAFAARLRILRARLIEDGYDAQAAEALALVCTNALQGSLVMARVECSRAPIEQTAAQLARMVVNGCARPKPAAITGQHH